jgi:hypothetical protein
VTSQAQEVFNTGLGIQNPVDFIDLSADYSFLLRIDKLDKCKEAKR